MSLRSAKESANLVSKKMLIGAFHRYQMKCKSVSKKSPRYMCAVFIVLTCNIVTGIMLGFVTLVVGRVFAREWQKLNIGTVIITAALVAFYAGGWAI